jgi:steroid 5-alpha reductase family enzyme
MQSLDHLISQAYSLSKQIAVVSSSSSKSPSPSILANHLPLNSSMPVRFEDIKHFVITTAICVGLSQLLAYGAASRSNPQSLSKIAFLATAIQWVFYLVHGSGLILGNQPTEMLYDLSGAITFTCCTVYSVFLAGGLAKLSLRQKLLNASVIMWCGRLGSFLFERILHEHGRDSRFDKVRPHFFRFWNFWTIQGLWVFLTAFPVFVLNDAAKDKKQRPLNYVDCIGFGLWIVGILFEAIADSQKKSFRMNPLNKGRFIDTGLWSLSRHPNCKLSLKLILTQF